VAVGAPARIIVITAAVSGLGAVALVMAILFGGIAAASWVGGEPFLTVMGAIGCLMTLWVGALTLVRG